MTSDPPTLISGYEPDGTPILAQYPDWTAIEETEGEALADEYRRVWETILRAVENSGRYESIDEHTAFPLFFDCYLSPRLLPADKIADLEQFAAALGKDRRADRAFANTTAVETSFLDLLLQERDLREERQREIANSEVKPEDIDGPTRDWLDHTADPLDLSIPEDAEDPDPNPEVDG